MQLWTYESMSENIGLPEAKDCETCSLQKDVPLLNFLTYMNVFVGTFSYRKTCLYATCNQNSCLILITMFPRKCVDYETSSCTCLQTRKTCVFTLFDTKICLCV